MKNYKKILWWLIGVYLAGFISAVFVAGTSWVLRSDWDGSHLDLSEAISQPLGLFSLFIGFLSLAIFFLREEIFHAWIKFARIYLPIAILLILWAPSSDSSLFPLDKEVMSLVTSVLFLFISLLIIGIKSWKLRKIIEGIRGKVIE